MSRVSNLNLFCLHQVAIKKQRTLIEVVAINLLAIIDGIENMIYYVDTYAATEASVT